MDVTSGNSTIYQLVKIFKTTKQPPPPMFAKTRDSMYNVEFLTACPEFYKSWDANERFGWLRLFMKAKIASATYENQA